MSKAIHMFKQFVIEANDRGHLHELTQELEISRETITNIMLGIGGINETLANKLETLTGIPAAHWVTWRGQVVLPMQS